MNINETLKVEAAKPHKAICGKCGSDADKRSLYIDPSTDNVLSAMVLNSPVQWPRTVNLFTCSNPHCRHRWLT